MVKSKATLSIDSYTWETAKSTYDNASERIEQLIEADLDASKIDDLELKERKINEIEDDLEDLNHERKKLDKKISSKESELEALKASIERSERKKEESSDKLEASLDTIRKRIDRGNWMDAEDIPKFHVKRTGLSQEELWTKAQKEVQES